MTRDDRSRLAGLLIDHARRALGPLEHALVDLSDSARRAASQIVASGPRLLERLREVASVDGAFSKIRVHGDYHLGQVLWSENDFVILDFEGEPARPLSERRAKQSPLKDVAGMLRSYSYAAYAGLFAHTVAHPDDFERLERWAHLWQTWSSVTFLRAYLAAAGGAAFLPPTPAAFVTLLRAFVLDKALYEVLYELNSRPGWLEIPLWGILGLVDAQRV
jgi:maltose alpha-D-glucosyltransferase/alpha-amylase